MRIWVNMVVLEATFAIHSRFVGKNSGITQQKRVHLYKDPSLSRKETTNKNLNS